MSSKLGHALKRRSLPRLSICTVVWVTLVGIAGNNIYATQPAKVGSPANQFTSEVAVSWFKLQVKLAKETPGFSPPAASRAFGYVGVTLYEAIVPGIPTHQSLVGQLNGLTSLPQPAIEDEYHWPTVANSALASISKRFFAHATALNLAAIASLEEKYNKEFQASLAPKVFDRSVSRGRIIAEAIYKWSLTDGERDGYVKNILAQYVPLKGPGLWVRTPPYFLKALAPFWGNNRPFVLRSGSDCAPAPHPAYSEKPGSAFYAEAMEVYTTTKNLTAEQRAIAEFWADNPGQTSTPPGHSISILNQILEQKKAPLDIAAEAYAKVGMAVTDAFIACWYTKYQYNLVRPITFINKFIDATWTSPVLTPPFPEFPSGHSVQSAAAAQVMTDMFGAVAFVDHTHDSRGLAPRSFNSFFDAVNEAAISRLYGGIHYRSAIELGLQQGKCIGQKISTLKFKKTAGSKQQLVSTNNDLISSIERPAISSQQRATSNKRQIITTAEIQVDFVKKTATLKPVAKTQPMPGEKIDFLQAALAAAPVINLIRLKTSNFQFDALDKIFSFDVTLTNTSSSFVFTPIRTVITKLLPGPPEVEVLNPDGGGKGNGAFYDYNEFVGLDKLLKPNETSSGRRWMFFTPPKPQFTMTVIVEGELQRTTEPPAPVIQPPSSPTKQPTIQISGTTDPNAQIEIFGGFATATTTADANGNFTVPVDLLLNRGNRLFATAINAIGRSAPTLVEVTHDAQAPFVFIDVPSDSAVLTNDTTTVIGRVSDVLSGFLGLTVTVNGQPANVAVGIGTNGTFERQNIPLALGANKITVVASDVVGNSDTVQTTVTRIDVSGQPQMVIFSGNNQKAQVNTMLPQPIVVKVTKPDGSPYPKKLVTFDVTRSDGRLSAVASADTGALFLQVRTDADGLAIGYWLLGSDAGSGNNRVSVTSTNIIGSILFSASATPRPASQINVGSGANQRAEAGGPAQEALRVWVSDGVNGIPDIPVTFTVTQGGGKVNAASSFTVNTGMSGHAQVSFNLGPNPGNNYVAATFPGNAASPATFVIWGMERTNQPTSFTGLVLNNANQPIQGTTCVLQVEGVTLSKSLSDSTGHFVFTDVPAGAAHLHVDGDSATAVNGRPILPHSFPALAFETIVVPNVENSLPTPVLLPPLNPKNARVYDGTKDVELTVEGIEGLKMVVKKNSMRLRDGTFPDSTHPAIISLNQVHFDKIPMPMPDGTAPQYSGTLQPMGATFDPPVQVIFPNITGLPPGTVSNFNSFNHETNRFEIVATGHITEDGTAFVTDPGSGIPVAGWHSPEPPPPPPEDTDDDDDDEPSNKCEEDKGMDPVYFFSGEFHESIDDLRIKGRGIDFVWTRKYRSKIGPNTSQGNGWDFSYNIFFEERLFPVAALVGDHLTFSDGNTRRDHYFGRLENFVFSFSRPEFFREFDKNTDSTYTLTFEDKTQWHFKFVRLDRNPELGDLTRFYKISKIIDRHGNQLTFDYDTQGRLVKVTDTLGRDIFIGYNTDGFIETVTDFAGRAVRYEYYQKGDSLGNFGDLKSVTAPAVTGTPNGNDFPDGKTTTYTYSTGFSDDRLNHNLLTITDGRRNDPNDPTFQESPYLINIYADTTNYRNFYYDRIVRQIWGGDTLDVVYVPQTPSTENGNALLKVILNDREGHVKEYFYDIYNRGVISREYTGRADPTRPTTETSNRPRGKLRPSDPDFFETRYEYNRDGMLMRTIYPNGNITENVYEADLNPEAPSRSRGNLRISRRFPGSHIPAGDQARIEEFYEYDTDFNPCCGFNFVTKHTDGRGNVTRHEYDERGNRIRTLHRIPSIVEDFEYNQFGQLTAQMLPDNGSGHRRRDVYTYYDSGPQRGYLHQKIIDSTNFALTTSYEYDLVGNVIRRIDPRGHDTQYVVNALDQVVREISREVRDGSGVRYQTDTFYDANNNVIRRDLKNIDEQGKLVKSNAFFATTYEYEVLNNLIRTTEEIDTLNVIVTEYGYDNNRNRTLIRYGEATRGAQPTNTLHIIYNERDLVFREIRAAGVSDKSTTQYDYDRNGNLAIRRVGIENTPRVFSSIYDGYNRLVKTIDPMGNVMTYNYDAKSNRVRERHEGELNDVVGDSNNVRLSETVYVYDEMDRQIRTEVAFFDIDTQVPIDDGTATTQMFYNDNSQIIRIVDDNNHETRTSYDTANRQKVVTDAKGNTLAYTYDANNNVISLTEVEQSDLGSPADTFVTKNEYDNIDRRIKTIDNVGNINEYGYDSRHNRTLHSDALRSAPDKPGNITKMTYDGLNRLIRTTRYLTNDGSGSGAVIDSILTTQAWDNSSRLITQTDDNGNATKYSYDPLNRLIATTYADGTVHRNTYDVHDNKITMTDANGSVATCTYDLLNRLAGKSIARGQGIGGTTFEIFKYDGLSRIVLAQDDDSEVTRHYDSLSRVTKEVQNGKTISCIYDGVDNQLRCIYPGGRIITTSYDELNRKNLIVDQFGPIARYDYIGPKRVEQRDYANNSRTTYQYDGVKRIIRTIHTFDPTGNPQVIDDRSYTWDQMYNKTSRKDLRLGGLAHAYEYDSIYRLIRSTKMLPSGKVDTIVYNFDGVGNRTKIFGGPHPGNYSMNPQQPEPADFQMNQYTTTSFDARFHDNNGNLSRINAGLTDQRTFTYDYHNQMIEFRVSATGITAGYTYDALGRRIEKVVNDGINSDTTRFFYNDWQECEEQDETGKTQATYVYGLYIDEVLNMQRDVDKNGAAEDYFYYGDDLHNVMAVTNSVGAIVERYEYQDYGGLELFNASGTHIAKSIVENSLLYTGRRFDSETDFYYYRTRYLDTETGRFTSRDLIGIWEDEDNLGNGIAYVLNNPFTYVDPDGTAHEKQKQSTGKKNLQNHQQGEARRDASRNKKWPPRKRPPDHKKGPWPPKRWPLSCPPIIFFDPCFLMPERFPEICGTTPQVL